MAVINCPECNEKISNTVKQCVHCGASIVICPECGTAFVEGVKLCTECGYEFKKKNEKSTIKKESKNEQEGTQFDAEQLESKVKESEPKWSFIDLLELLCAVVPGLLCLFVFFLISNWSDSPERMLTYIDVQKTCTIVMVISAILFVGEAIFNVINEKNTMQKFINTSRAKQTELHKVIENTLIIDYSKKKPEYADDQADSLKKILNAEIYDKDQSARPRFKNWVAVVIICKAVFCLCLFLFLQHNIGIYMTKELFKADMLNIPGWSWTSVERWWLLAVEVIALVIKKIYTSRVKKDSVNRRRDWINQNFSQSLQVYDTYLDGFYSARKYGDDTRRNNTRGGV